MASLVIELKTEEGQFSLEIQKLVNAFRKIWLLQIFITFFSWCGMHLGGSDCSGATFELP